jgi:hypothetical protein
MSTSLKYGCITPNAKGREYPVAASQYFCHAGGHWVYLDSSGHVTLAITATTYLFGWAVSPAGVGAGAAGSAYWLSSATAGADKVFVITDPTAEFCMPADATATAAYEGRTADLVSVNDGTAQVADLGTTSTDVLLVQKVATDLLSNAAATDVIVKLNQAKLQAVTS